MDEDVRFILGLIITIILIVFLTCGLGYYLDKKSCEKISIQMDVNWEYSFFTECMIKVNNKWIPLDKYRGMEGELK